jgi:hypothetical protein
MVGAMWRELAMLVQTTWWLYVDVAVNYMIWMNRKTNGEE